MVRSDEEKDQSNNLRIDITDVGMAGRANRQFSATRDLPDAVGLQDLAERPDLTAKIILSRFGEGRFPFDGFQFPLPKKGGMRRLVWMDPFDEIAIRLIVGRCTPELRRHESKEVYSHRLETTGPGWSCTPYRSMLKRRRADGVSLLERDETRFIGTGDIKAFYPSVDVNILEAQLARIGVARDVRNALVSSLLGLAQLAGPAGLPIGFEGSGLLGSFFLGEADRAVSRLGVPFIRFSDDCWFFLASEEEWETVLETWHEALERLGIAPNLEKQRLLAVDSPEARDILVNGRIDSLIHMDRGHVSASEAVALVLDNLDADAAMAEFHFGLRVLGRQNDGRAVRSLFDHPDVIVERPTAVGDYLCGVMATPEGRDSIDREWVVDWAVGDVRSEPRSLAARTQMARVASHVQLPSTLGRRMADLSTSAPEARQVPLRHWASYAAAKSEGQRPTEVAERAQFEGNLSVRRGHLLGLANQTLSRAADKALTRLAAIHPELGPSVAFVQSRSAA